jgi:hypothetical protein
MKSAYRTSTDGGRRPWGGRHHRLLAAVLAMALAGATAVCAGPTETGDIRLEEGFVDPQSGVRVDSVTTDPVTGTQEVRFAVPRSADPVDEVVVTGRRPERKPLVQTLPHKFVADYEHDYYGLVVYLGKHEDVPVRLYLDSRQQKPGSIVP